MFTTLGKCDHICDDVVTVSRVTNVSDRVIIAGEWLGLLVLGRGNCLAPGALLGVADPLEALLAPHELAHVAGRLLGTTHSGHLRHGHCHHLPE